MSDSLKKNKNLVKKVLLTKDDQHCAILLNHAMFFNREEMVSKIFAKENAALKEKSPRRLSFANSRSNSGFSIEKSFLQQSDIFFDKKA